MRVLAVFIAVVVSGVLLAGCVDGPAQEEQDTGDAPPVPTYASWEFDLVQVDDALSTSEPGILAAPDGTLWIVGPTGFVTPATEADAMAYAHDSGAFWSKDGGATWEFNARVPMYGRDACPGGGDSDLAAAPDGALFLIDLNLENVPIDMSTDGGETWTFNCHTSIVPGVDRQWVAATDEYVWISVNHLALGPIVYRAPRLGLPAADGLVFEPPVQVEQGGVIVADPVDGTLYLSGSGETVMVSTDDGSTWSAHETGLAGIVAGLSFTSIALDADGAVFVAALAGDAVAVSGSADKGGTWSAPTLFSPYQGEYVFAWVAAGGHGVVDVAWYGRPAENDTSGFGGEAYGYYLYAAQSDTVLTGGGGIQTIARVSPTPVTTKDICMGLLCDSGGDRTRALGDFFEIGVDNEGHAIIAYNDAEAHDPPLLMFAKQRTGTLAPPRK